MCGRALLAVLAAAALVGGAACQMRSESSGAPKQWPSPPAMRVDANKTYNAKIQTSMGEINATLLVKEAPTTVNNFVFLSREGFYDGVKFHRIIKGFMVQTGDPVGNGTGGAGPTFSHQPGTSKQNRGCLPDVKRGPT